MSGQSGTPSATTGPISKPWAVSLLRKQGVQVTSDEALREHPSSPGENDVASNATSSGVLALETKRAKLTHSIEIARDAGASAAVISSLQADLDAIPPPKIGEDEMDLGSLLQLRAKQQAHHQAKLETSQQEVSAIQQQIQVLTASVTRLQEATKVLEGEHQANMAKIDQAIAKIRLQAVGSSPIGQLDASMLDSTPSKAQVLSEALGNAVNDNTFFTNVSAEHQAAIKTFCALVTSAYATQGHELRGSASAAGTTDADVGMHIGLTDSHDRNPHNFVGHTA